MKKMCLGWTATRMPFCSLKKVPKGVDMGVGPDCGIALVMVSTGADASPQSETWCADVGWQMGLPFGHTNSESNSESDSVYSPGSSSVDSVRNSSYKMSSSSSSSSSESSFEPRF